MKKLALALMTLCALSAMVSSAHAHPLAPASLTMLETEAPTRYAITFRRGSRLAPALEVDLPKGCEVKERKQALEGDAIVRDDLTVRCRTSLQGQTVAIKGLTAHGVFALVVARFQNGRQVRAVLSPDSPAFAIPKAESAARVFASYAKLGVEHLLTGTDHLAFVLGLCLLVNRLARVVITLTAFTLGHSVTLALASVDLLRLPSAQVEVVIALTIVVLALELLASERQAGGRSSYVLALGFGLIHGLGFAGALGEVGLAGHAIALSLFAFNLGLEAAQLLVLFAASPLLWWLAHAGARFVPTTRTGFGYAIGALSAMWCIERTLAML